MPFFSIIVPTYNSEKHIAACLDSIVQQTFTDYELILQDGLSSDNTLAIINDYRKTFKHINISVESIKDTGVYDAMNRGISRSSGDWLYFLGSDDKLFDREILQHMYLECMKSAEDILYGEIFNERSNQLMGQEFTPEVLYQQNICHQAIFFKRSVFARTGVYDTRYKVLADWAHNFKWFLDSSLRKKFISKTIASYGDNGLSWTTTDELFQQQKADLYYGHAKRVISIPFKKKMLKILTVTSYKQKRYFKACRHLLNYFFLQITNPGR